MKPSWHSRRLVLLRHQDCDHAGPRDLFHSCHGHAVTRSRPNGFKPTSFAGRGGELGVECRYALEHAT